MNPLAAMAMGAFVNKFPGVADLLTKFPNFKQETKDRLLSFAKLLSESEDPESLLIETLDGALNPKPGKVKKGKVEVIEVKQNK